jgi:hypothetical protein
MREILTEQDFLCRTAKWESFKWKGLKFETPLRAITGFLQAPAVAYHNMTSQLSK